MPQIETIYAPTLYRTVEDLCDWMIRARAYGYVTLNQGRTVVRELAPMLPVTASLALRTPKTTLYLTANGTQIRVNQRAHADYEGWNLNPRRPARNSWID